jgi:hypothetical protein
MKSQSHHLAILFLVTILTACNDNTKALQTEVATLRAEVTQLRVEVEQIKRSTSSLEAINTQTQTQAEDQALMAASRLVFEAGQAIMQQDPSLGAIAVAQALQAACKRSGDVPEIKVFGKPFARGWTDLDQARSECLVIAPNNDSLQVVMKNNRGRSSTNGAAPQ